MRISVEAIHFLNDLHLTDSIKTVLVDLALSCKFRLHRCIDIAVWFVIKIKFELLMLINLLSASAMGRCVWFLSVVISLVLFWRAFLKFSFRTVMPTFDSVCSGKILLVGVSVLSRAMFTAAIIWLRTVAERAHAPFVLIFLFGPYSTTFFRLIKILVDRAFWRWLGCFLRSFCLHSYRLSISQR